MSIQSNKLVNLADAQVLYNDLRDRDSSLKSALEQTNENLSHIYDEDNELVISQSTLLHPNGDATITIDSENQGFDYTRVSNQNNVVGISMPTEVGKQYKASFTFESANGTIVGFVVKGTSFSSTTYLAKTSEMPSGFATMTFTATTTTTTIWFLIYYDVLSAEFTNVTCSSGWKYGSLDTTLTSKKYPAQGKAVGDRFNEFPNAEWLGYDNLFAITADDLITDTGLSITRTISGNNLTLVTSQGNAQTSYKLNGLTPEEYYIFDFDCTADLTVAAGNKVCITTGATSGNMGSDYALFTKGTNHYSCEFKAIGFVQTFALFTAYNSGTIELKNISIRKSSITGSDSYCDYKGNDVVTFHKCLCIGDSLTYGGFNANNVDPDVGISSLAEKYSYPTFFEKITGIETTKLAVGGITSVEWYQLYENTDTSGHDMAIVQLGVNDGSPSHYGGWTQASIDAFTDIITKLKNENKGIKIFVATTVPAPAFNDQYREAVCTGIRELVSDLNDDDVILADIHLYGHTGDKEAYSAGHLTAYGYYRLAQDYVSLISYIMKNNSDNYRFIQFIGTDYTYGN